MMTNPLLKALLLIITLLSTMLNARTWTSADDGRTFEAEYISHNTESVQIKLGWSKITVPINKFSEKDHKWLAEKQIKQLAEVAKNKKGTLKSHQANGANIPNWYSYTPYIYSTDNEKHPVCILYSYGGETKEIVQRMAPAADQLGWILIGIDSYSNQRAQGKDIDKVISDCKIIHKLAFEQFHIDPLKTVYGGMSGGGWWSFASTHRFNNKAAAVMSFGGWMSKEYNYKYPNQMAVAVVNGDKDNNARDWEKKDGDFLINTHQANVRVFRFPGGHVLAPSDVCLKAAKWIHEAKEFSKNF